jgi:hypothetical protein
MPGEAWVFRRSIQFCFSDTMWGFADLVPQFCLLGCDSGSGDFVGCFQSQVFGIGPQFGYVFPLSQGLLGYVNLKGYAEFGRSDRPSGWNTWLTFVISPAAAAPPPVSRMITK